MNNIQKTINYVLEQFETSEYLQDKLLARQYRLDHTFRVANIGKEIAKNEELNVLQIKAKEYVKAMNLLGGLE